MSYSLGVCDLSSDSQVTGSSNALLNDGKSTVFCFPVLPFLVCRGKQGDTQITQETPDSVVPGVMFIGVAHQVKGHIKQFFDQRAIGLDTRFVGVIEVVTPRHRIAALRVGMGERDYSDDIGAELAALGFEDASMQHPEV